MKQARVNVNAVVCGIDVGGVGNTVVDALIGVGRDCGKRANEFEEAARALRRAERSYHHAAHLIMDASLPEVGSPPREDHKNDVDEEGDDDGRQGHDFTVGEEG